LAALVVAVPVLVGCAWLSDWETEVHYLPKGYTGSVLIVYDFPTGSPIKKRNGKRIFEIPANGILLLSDPTQKEGDAWIPKDGWQVYYADERDTQRLVTASRPDEIKESQDVYAFSHVAYGIAGSKNADIKYERYFVGRKPNNLDSLAEIEDRQIQSVLDSLKGMQR
jgi:hypothetical protein